MGPTAIFDKSALEALSVDEAVWLQQFLRADVVPVFYVETLADLEKPQDGDRTPEAVVGRLAEKTPDNAAPNVHHHELMLSELAGGTIEMAGRPPVRAADYRQAADSTIGVHIAEFPETTALRRWQSHDFVAVERDAARRWRAELANHDPSRRVAVLKNILPAGRKISDLEQLKAFIDEFCDAADPAVIALAFDVLEVPDDYRQAALARWQLNGTPVLREFAPYTTHLFKVELLFYLGIAFSFISGERTSNKADMAYLYYLPFVNVFISGDRLHKRTVPLFLRTDQTYLDRDELKAALRELDEHYDALPDAIKQIGVMSFASYPPAELDNAITRLWDKHMPGWRDISRRMKEEVQHPRDAEADRETVDELNRKLDGARPLTGADAPMASGDADYIVVQRFVHAYKGKWRMISEEIEKAGAEDPQSGSGF